MNHLWIFFFHVPAKVSQRHPRLVGGCFHMTHRISWKWKVHVFFAQERLEFVWQCRFEVGWSWLKLSLTTESYMILLYSECIHVAIQNHYTVCIYNMCVSSWYSSTQYFFNHQAPTVNSALAFLGSFDHLQGHLHGDVKPAYLFGGAKSEVFFCETEKSALKSNTWSSFCVQVYELSSFWASKKKQSPQWNVNDPKKLSSLRFCEFLDQDVGPDQLCFPRWRNENKTALDDLKQFFCVAFFSNTSGWTTNKIGFGTWLPHVTQPDGISMVTADRHLSKLNRTGFWLIYSTPS